LCCDVRKRVLVLVLGCCCSATSTKERDINESLILTRAHTRSQIKTRVCDFTPNLLIEWNYYYYYWLCGFVQLVEALYSFSTDVTRQLYIATYSSFYVVNTSSLIPYLLIFSVRSKVCIAFSCWTLPTCRLPST